MELNMIDFIASLIFLAVLIGLGCYWAWAISNKDKHKIRRFEDYKFNNKLEDE